MGDGLTQAIEGNQTLLRDILPVEQRKLVLRIVDELNMMATDLSMDSFICGFKLAWQMANELNSYENRRSTPAKQAGLNACLYYVRKMEYKKTLLTAHLITPCGLG
ncbi:MAG: hypothetical protein VB096_02285 [Pseudoflavonifractor sp.]|nr:hypothetical protein [Pseudoflavonifractor sp.]